MDLNDSLSELIMEVEAAQNVTYRVPRPLREYVGHPCPEGLAPKYLEVKCPHLPGYTYPFPHGKKTGEVYPPATWLGPVRSVLYTREYVCARVKAGDRFIWVNVWCRHNLNGQRVGVNYCGVSTGLPVYAQIDVDEYGDVKPTMGPWRAG